MDGWRPVRTDDGSFTLAHPLHGETCHSRAGAWQESRERYAQACKLHERALELRAEGRATLRLLDVGTGLGLNLAAALDALAGTDVALDAVSLELDRDVIAATLALEPSSIDDLERAHAPVREALARALDARETIVPLGERGTLRLLLGDASATLAALADRTPFDAVFLDPFSPRVEPDLWTPAFLAEIAHCMAPKSLLSTYSASMRVRAGLLAAGLRVGPGGRVGTKSSGTLAARGIELDPFDARTLRRLRGRAEIERTASQIQVAPLRGARGFESSQPPSALAGPTDVEISSG